MAMADPKYENLPGIAYGQPDVYETGDLPEADQQEIIEDEDNECIERIHLSVKDSFGKFKGKFVADKVDFSDRIGKKTRSGYRVGEYTLAANDDVETTSEKFQRLKCEISELWDQVIDQKNQSAEDEKDEIMKLASQIEATKKTLDLLSADEGETVDPKVKELKLLLAETSCGKKNEFKGQMKAHIKLLPDHTNLGQTTRIAKLEHRLHQLESMTGVRDEDTLRKLQIATGERTISGAANVLAARTAMIQPSELTICEARVTALLSNIDTLNKSTDNNVERDTKINELYNKLKEIEGVPHSEIIERLEALESLHNQASEFGKSLTELENLQTTLESQLENNKSLLQGVQDIFAHNIDSLKSEIEKLNERISKLK